MAKGKFIEIRKRETWIYLLKYYDDQGFMPTLREIGNNAYKGTTLTAERVRQLLSELEKDGKVKIGHKKSRSIKLVPKIK